MVTIGINTIGFLHVHMRFVHFVFPPGSCLLKLAVKKDGHCFYTHINHCVVDPVIAPTHLQYKESSDKKEECKGKDSRYLEDVNSIRAQSVDNCGE